MCVGIEYFRDGERITVYFDSPAAAELPVCLRDRAVVFYPWGARHAEYFRAETIGGHARSFPVRGWLSLESIRAGEWDNSASRRFRRPRYSTGVICKRPVPVRSS